MSYKKYSQLWSVTLLSLVLTFALHSCTLANATMKQTEILWDTWGVPHIFAKDNESLFKAFGWAQMHSHGNLILRLYGEARGRAAEYWGEKYLESDKEIWSLGIPTLAAQWYEAQKPEMRRYLDAFARGMNEYGESHSVDEMLQPVFPITGVDILAHALRNVHFTFLPQAGSSPRLTQNWQQAGSNAWAIAPKRSASGHAMLLANPHLQWSGQFLLYEAQLTSPDLNLYGATLVGMPILVFAFNDNLGWTHTVNTIDAVDLYELTLVSQGNQLGYEWDGGFKPLEITTQTLQVKQPDGSFRSEPLVIYRSIHGLVLDQKDNKALAMRIAGLDQPDMLGQYWDMARSQNLEEFETALKRLQIPMFTVLYADKEGHILHVFNGQVPKRPPGSWDGVVPGNSSATLWMQTHPYEELPRVLDPKSGWLQNANDPPWTTTFPSELNPQDYPAYMAPQFMHLRAQRSAKLLSEGEKLSFEEMIERKNSTHVELADRVLDDLLGVASTSDDPIVQQAVKVLQAWNRNTNADSQGGVLFAAWMQAMNFPKDFATPWDANSPLTTPSGLANPSQAVEVLATVAPQVQETYGSLTVPWGDVFRLKYGKHDVPASGGSGSLGVFRVFEFIPVGKQFLSGFGDTFIAAVEFSHPLRAKVLNTYGNASQPDSPHAGDQLELMGQLRDVWRDRTSIEAHLEYRESF